MSPGERKYEYQQKTWHRGIKRGHLLYNTQLSVHDTEIELSLNVHTDAKKIIH